jgi:hypothetical protein
VDIKTDLEKLLFSYTRPYYFEEIFLMKTAINSTHTHTEPAQRLRKSALLNVIIMMISLSFYVGCVSLISDYNLHTYKGLTELKGEMKIAFEKFGENGASGENDQKTLQAFLVKMSQALEYEKGKDLNNDTIAQFAILDETVREVIERFESGGSKLSAGYAKAKWMILENAFDIAIETEKNKINKEKGGK